MNLVNAIFTTIPIGIIIACIIAITIKEFTKAIISTKLGDPLPKRDGRLTLNPIKHLEPIGLFLMVFFGLGWGKPVETTSLYYNNRKRDTLITYIMPSVINLVAGIIFALAYYRFFDIYGLNFATVLLGQISLVNLNLAIFNIIPIPPLDGSKVLTTITKPNNVIKIVSREKLYQVILIIFIIWTNSPLVNAIGYLSDSILRALYLL